MNSTIFDSPLGKLHLKSSQSALAAVSFADNAQKVEAIENIAPVLSETIQQLKEYFSGERTQFTLPLAPGGSAFQQRVWDLLQEIPFGQTITYGELSEKLGDPKAVRAVGTANGKNPIPIIIPCHRVIGSNKKLTGYAGGIERKRWLLQHEGALLL